MNTSQKVIALFFIGCLWFIIGCRNSNQSSSVRTPVSELLISENEMKALDDSKKDLTFPKPDSHVHEILKPEKEHPKRVQPFILEETAD